MKIGLFFGTFNPVHLGHVEIVSRFLDENIFEELWIVLTPRSPHKNYNLVKKENRLEMLNLAFRNYKKVIISDVEFSFKHPNYTINTLNYLSTNFPNFSFSIIMGSDNFLSIKTWKDSIKIIEKYNIYVYPREGFFFKNNMNYKSIHYLDFPKIEISATFIREKILYNEKKAQQYLPAAVYNYIKTHQLY